MDRETVITHLQIIHTWALFARERNLNFFTARHLEDIAKWADNAIDLLKEQDELLKYEYWRGYNNGRADERGLQEGTIMQTFSPD